MRLQKYKIFVLRKAKNLHVSMSIRILCTFAVVIDFVLIFSSSAADYAS